ncbi:hypothetical protein F6R98_12725 [Candidatus Methylospira mobilis]|uniref:Ferritin-like domain-containing protein n=1 Tax=Candidatus Methylospira mobilis TaxID=1808979 RepID=A0A5Q0BMC1_9GAMM|nr:hypothetical protein [Candidatus Methylospira mobilis]QFY43374.1 hypothetical protein F6R98_12725 [Candidatus Methylospira mobilis]WNV03407.1 hypothetical protein RP726_13195 [Candidatus Methylospira mobilis]
MSNVQAGSDTHMVLFCSNYINTYKAFEPERLPWPELTDAELERMRGVPFWQEILYTEMRAITIIDAFSATVENPLIRKALDLMGKEEKRHEHLIRYLIAHYGITIADQSLEPLPADIETTFIDFGFGECVDSFIGFGFFKIARETEFLPEPLLDILDILMEEEVRHVLFIINWMAYREARHGRRAAPLRALTSLWYYGRAISSLVNVALRNARNESNGVQFSATQAGEILGETRLRHVLESCLAENARRLATYDKKLLRPLFLPRVAGALLAVLKLGSLFGTGKRELT